jgi:hypothetical protein
MQYHFWTSSIVFIPPLLSAIASDVARADVLELTNGGRVEGRIVQDSAADKTRFTIELPAGGRLTITRSEVSRVDTTSEFEAQYTELARTSPDTIEAHWKLSEWCREHRLRNLSQQHLARILELDPNHAEARTLLGFRKAGGQWMTRDQVMAARGMVKYDGRYVTRQHVELLDRQKKVESSQSDWTKELDRLRRWLTGRRTDRAAEARADILAIRDPMATEAIVALIRRENDPELRRLWIEVASKLDSQLALETLIDLSLKDPNEELRNVCLEYVIQSHRPGIVTPYIHALKNRDNEMINRAGAALGQIGNREAIGPLIDALVTKHKVQVTEGSSGDQHAYTFTEGGGFSFGSKAPKFENRAVQNPAVLSALVSLAGGTSFDYDQAQWRTWLAAQAKDNAVDVRRDE